MAKMPWDFGNYSRIISAIIEKTNDGIMKRYWTLQPAADTKLAPLEGPIYRLMLSQPETQVRKIRTGEKP
jgi:hypothetical protein